MAVMKISFSRLLGLGLCLVFLAACSSSPKLKPASLSAIDERIGLRAIWSQPADPAPSIGWQPLARRPGKTADD